MGLWSKGKEKHRVSAIDVLMCTIYGEFALAIHENMRPLQNQMSVAIQTGIWFLDCDTGDTEGARSTIQIPGIGIRDAISSVKAKQGRAVVNGVDGGTEG